MAKLYKKSGPPMEMVEIVEPNSTVLEKKASVEWTPVHTMVFEPFNRLLLVLVDEFAEPFGENKAIIIEGARKRMIQIRNDLAPKTALEKLLVERIIVCWLECHLVDMHVSVIQDPKVKNIYIKRQLSAHKRYLSAIKALAQIRKLEIGAIQVNIQTNQFNSN